MIDLPEKFSKTSLTKLAKEFLGPTARATKTEASVEVSFIPAKGGGVRVVIGRGKDWTDAAEKVFLGPLAQRYERALEIAREKNSDNEPASETNPVDPALEKVTDNEPGQEAEKKVEH